MSMASTIVFLQRQHRTVEDLKNFESLLSDLKTQPRIKSVSYGLTRDSAPTFCVIINYDASVATPPDTTEIVAPLQSSASLPIIVHSSTFPAPLEPLINSPITALTSMSFPLGPLGGISSDEAIAAAAEFETTQNQVASMIALAPGSTGTLQSWANGDYEHERLGRAKCHLMLAGWENEDMYLDFVKRAMKELPPPDSRIDVVSHLVKFKELA